MKKRGYTWFMREWGGTWKFGDFMESILCQCEVANRVNCFGMLKFCLVCFVVRIEQSWSKSSA